MCRNDACTCPVEDKVKGRWWARYRVTKIVIGYSDRVLYYIKFNKALKDCLWWRDGTTLKSELAFWSSIDHKWIKIPL